jgi:hypothetical protein
MSPPSGPVRIGLMVAASNDKLAELTPLNNYSDHMRDVMRKIQLKDAKGRFSALPSGSGYPASRPLGRLLMYRQLARVPGDVQPGHRHLC